jgi:hypothetical protein
MLCVLYYHVMEVMITVAFAVGIVADQHLVLNQIKSIQLLKGIIVILSFQLLQMMIPRIASELVSSSLGTDNSQAPPPIAEAPWAPITLSLAPDYSRGQLLTTCYIIDNYSPNMLVLDSEDGMGMLALLTSFLVMLLPPFK